MASSKKDIAKQFELPERQSEIASIMKESEVYCICRSTDSTSFMIACDNCEEWFHGHCVSINEVQSRQVKHYYCTQCRKENPGLKIEYKKPKGSSASHGHGGSSKEKIEKEVMKQDHPPPAPPQKSGTKKGPGRPFKATEKKPDPDKDLYQPHNKRLTQRNEVEEFVAPPPRAARRGRPLKDDPCVFGGDLKGLRQCFQPTCQKAARPNSKYCSEACGLMLASTRMHIVLKYRAHEVSVKSIAEEHNDRDLTEIKKKYDATFQMIKDLQTKRDKLDEHIAKVERLKFDPEYEEEDTEEEGIVACASCGRDVPMRDSIKHMEKCYHKYESQMSFGSKFATSVEGTPIFCDFFNLQSKTYCKRLRVLCNEHTKEPKISDTAICGCPADTEVKVGGKFCRNLKKTCSKHYSWEKLRRGEIDQERVRQFMKIDDLLEQERVVLQAKQDRGGVMGFMLNSTFDHDLDEKMTEEDEAQQRQQREYEEEIRQREAKAQKIRQEQEKIAMLRHEQEMKKRRDFEREKDAQLKREELKMRQQMAEAKKTLDSKASGAKSVSKQLVAAVADKNNLNYSSSSSYSGSGSGSGSSTSGSGNDDDEEMMDVDDQESAPARNERPWQDSFVHLPSKREKSRRTSDPSTEIDPRAFRQTGEAGTAGSSEMTASRLSKRK